MVGWLHQGLKTLTATQQDAQALSISADLPIIFEVPSSPSARAHQALIAGWPSCHVKKTMAEGQATVFFFLWDDQRAINKGTEKVSQTSFCSDCTEAADNGRSTVKSVKVKKDCEGKRCVSAAPRTQSADEKVI